MDEKKETIGALALKAAATNDGTDKVMEIAEAMAESYPEEIFKAVDRGIAEYPNMDFYIVVLTKRERLMKNVLRNFFLVRLSPPTPAYEQTVYKYDHKKDEVEMVWFVLDKESVYFYIKNRKLVGPEDYDLVKSSMDFVDGTTFAKALKLNGELQ